MEKDLYLEKSYQFQTHLQNIHEILGSNQTEAVVVGGIALRAAMGKDVEFERANGTIPDIDMIGLGRSPGHIEKSVQEIKKYRESNPTCPDVGLEAIDFSNQPQKKYPLFEMLSGLRKDDNGRFYLTFRSLDQEISPLTMTPITRKYGQVDIKTLPQETIYFRYLVRMGYIKPKDTTKVDEFKKHLDHTGGDSLDPSLFIPYINFADNMCKVHPHITSLTRLYWNVDQKLNGKISGSSGFFYNIIKVFRRS